MPNIFYAEVKQKGEKVALLQADSSVFTGMGIDYVQLDPVSQSEQIKQLITGGALVPLGLFILLDSSKCMPNGLLYEVVFSWDRPERPVRLQNSKLIIQGPEHLVCYQIAGLS